MLGKEFFDNVEGHKNLEWLGVRELSSGEDEALVCHKETGIKHAIVVRSILAHPWKDLEEVMTGKRDPHVMTHLTRIVGYYSRISNWNPSKLEELKDRHKGNYACPETPTVSAPTTSHIAPVRERTERIAVPA